MPGAEAPGAEAPGAEAPGGQQWHVPTEAELAGYWPDPFAGPPDDGGAWFDSLSPAELDSRYGPVGEEAADPDLTGAGFAAGGPHDGLPPGRVLATLAQDIMDSGLAALSDDELVGMLRASRRLAAWQNGVELAAVAELDARRMAQAVRPRSSRASEHVSEELAAALTMTGRSADLLLGLARDLTRLPMILTALLEGRIDRARAVIFAAELAGLPDLAALAIAMVLAGTAGSMTTGQLRAALRAMVLRVDPAAARRRAERGRADARVEAWQETSGNGALAGRELPAGDAVAADKRITAIARALQHAGAAGSLDQLRAAVFVALLAGRDLESLVPAAAPAADPAPAGAGDEPGADGTPDPGSSRAGFAARPTGPTGPTGLAALTGSVHLTMPVSAWLGLADGPGEVAGLGPLDAWTCRDLAARLTAAGAATRWHVTLTGADGRAVTHACARGSPGQPAPPSPGGGVSRWLAGLTFTRIERGTCIHAREVSGYRPANVVRENVRVRQRTCGFPGCRRPARACDLDHTVPYDQGGRTCECNLAPLCRRHHRAKQAPGWRVDQSEPGILTWTLPHGRSYTAQADVYPV